MEGLTKEYLDKQLAKQTNEIKHWVVSHVDEQVEKLARIVNSAFEKQNKYIDERFSEQNKYIDQRFEGQRKYMDSRFDEIQQEIKAQHKDFLSLERRVRCLENHANI